MDFVVRLCVLGLSLCHYVYNNDNEDWNKMFYKLYKLTNISIRKSRMLWLGISYNFNSFKQRKAESKADSDRSLIKLGL